MKLNRCICAATALSVMLPSVAIAKDDAEKIGIAATFGLAAADGKTTLGNGAGATEASLLETDAVNETGAIIAALVNSTPPRSEQIAGTTLAPNNQIVLLARNETVNLIAAKTVKNRIDLLRVKLPENCPGGPSKGPFLEYKSILGEPTPKDIVAAVAVSTSFASLAVPVEDRLIINSILMNQGAQMGLRPSDATPSRFPVRWQAPEWASAPETTSAFVLPSEVVASRRGTILDSYAKLLAKADKLRLCGDQAEIKSQLNVVDTFVAGLNAVSDKAPASPLTLAVQSEALLPAEGQTAPRLLRIAVEHSGGTSIARSSIWYTLGWPGAATVGSGLIVSFRLMNPETGQAEATGIVRCAARQTNIKTVPANVRNPQPFTSACSYAMG